MIDPKPTTHVPWAGMDDVTRFWMQPDADGHVALQGSHADLSGLAPNMRKPDCSTGRRSPPGCHDTPGVWTALLTPWLVRVLSPGGVRMNTSQRIHHSGSAKWAEPISGADVAAQVETPQWLARPPG